MEPKPQTDAMRQPTSVMSRRPPTRYRRRSLVLGAWLAATALAATACGASTTAPAQHPPRLMPSEPTRADGSVRIAAVGDIACPPGEPTTAATCQQAATARLAASLNPDAVIALGDLQYESGSTTAFTESYEPTWGALRAVTRPLPGNHEYRTTDAAGYFASVDASDPWYAWDAGEWRIYMLNSNCDYIDCKAELNWLKDDLTKNPRSCSAIAMHHPRYSSGPHHSDESMTAFWQIAYDQHVDLALAAHDHDYERFEAMDPDGNLAPGRGITSFVSGTGGKSLYKMGRPVTGSAYFQSTQFGVLYLTLGPDSYSWKFHSTDRAVLDQGSTPCV